MAQPRTIEEFGLERNERQRDYFDSYTFLVPFVGPMKEEESEWICRQLDDTKGGTDTPAGFARDPWGLEQYSINSSKRTYVVSSAFLEGAQGRKTEMRLWQMIVANWLHAGHTPDSLRFLAFATIINHDVLVAIVSEFKHQLEQGREPYGTPVQRMLTITPEISTVTWTENQFVRCGLRVAKGLSTAEKKLTLTKVHLIRTYEMSHYMVLEFTNGDAGQENYRDELIRKLLPMTTHNLVQKEAERSAGREWAKIVFLPPTMYPGRK